MNFFPIYPCIVPTSKIDSKFIQISIFESIKKAIEKNGGKVGSSISKKTSYLIRGENMGPSKLKKAEDLDVSMIAENEFIKMIEQNPSDDSITDSKPTQGSLF